MPQRQPDYTARLTDVQAKILLENLIARRVRQLEVSYRSISNPSDTHKGRMTVHYGDQLTDRPVYEFHGNLDNHLITGRLYPSYDTINFYFN